MDHSSNALESSVALPRPAYNFSDIHGEGIYRPAPSIGSPTLVWHLGIQRETDPQPDKNEKNEPRTIDYLEKYAEHTKAFYHQISTLLEKLQLHGRTPSAAKDYLELKDIPMGISPYTLEKNFDNKIFSFKTCKKQALSFDLWWADKQQTTDGITSAQKPWIEDPPTSAIRVFVQLQIFQDHVTISFYMDVAKPFGMDQINTSDEVSKNYANTRRNDILKCIDTIRKSSLEQIRSRSIDTPAAEQPSTLTVSRHDLNIASNYLYDGVWKEFCKSFGILETTWFNSQNSDKLNLNACTVFTSQRGIMLSIKGLQKTRKTDDLDRQKIRELLIEQNFIHADKPLHLTPKDWEPDYAGATATLGPIDVFEKRIGEPETILKSVWPFLESTFRETSTRNWVGCGILDWRALLVLDISSLACDSKCDKNGAKLVHQKFLILSNGEPHREQIGRFVERFVALETMRLYALRYNGTILNAYITLRCINSEIDGIWEKWTAQRDKIEEQYKDVKVAWKRSDKNQKSTHSILNKAELSRERNYFHELRVLSSTVERKLIGIAAQLDRMGPSGAGQLAYKINHAEHYINEYRRMTPTLEIGNIDGWMNYQQFADRNMLPSFETIRRTGQRLADTQHHLRSLTEVVQTGVEIVHSHATQRNTDQLTKIATHFAFVKYTLAGILMSWLIYIKDNLYDLFEKLIGWIP